jgi:hypothetical protein
MSGELPCKVLVGIFWPSMMKLRSQYVPEDLRATILNLFRVPLNLFVCVVLYNVRLLLPCSELAQSLNLCQRSRPRAVFSWTFAMCHSTFLPVLSSPLCALPFLHSQLRRPWTCVRGGMCKAIVCRMTV